MSTKRPIMALSTLNLALTLALASTACGPPPADRSAPAGDSTAAEEAGAAGGAGTASEPLAVMLDSYLGRWEPFGFSAAVLVAREGKVVLEAGYGLADRGAGTPLTADTLLDIGSVSKQFTATAIMKLADRGDLRVEDSIAEVLRDVPADKRAITIHHLLTHTSGVSDFGKEAAGETRDALVASWLARPFTAPPGTEYEYSNLGYAVLAAIVEVVSGVPFEDFLHAELFAPADMRRTRLAWESDDRWAGLDVALGYGGFADPCGGEDPRGRPASFRLRGSGSVLSTVGDLLRWETALTGGRILEPDSLRLLSAPHTTAEADFLAYGYGWRIQQTPRGTKVVWHSGLEGAFSAMYRRYEDEDLVLIFLSNRSVDGVPMRNIMARPAREGLLGDLLFGGDVTVPPAGGISTIDPQALGAYAGPDGAAWRLEQDGEALRLRAENQAAADALFSANDPEVAELAGVAGQRARRAAEELRAGDLDAAARLAGPVDPLGYSRRGLAEAADQWRAREARLGPLGEVSVVASTWVRSGPKDRQVSHLRLHYEQGVADEHFLWYAEDETYLVPCAPESTSLPVVVTGPNRLTGFDPIAKTTRTIRLTTDPAGERILEIAPRGR